MTDVTQILLDIERGDSAAAEQLLPLVYDELRKLAAQRLRHEAPGQTLQPTALVHEAYLRLVGDQNGSGQSRWDNRGHFFAAAAEAMRRILVESARRKSRIKHGGGRQRVDLREDDDSEIPEEPSGARPEEILALDEALSALKQEDAEAAQIVHLHFFAGLSIEQAAGALNISRATAYRQWTYARAWLRCAIGREISQQPNSFAPA